MLVLYLTLIKMKKFLKFIFISLFVIILTVGTYILTRGYFLYKSAIEEKSILTCVSEIQQSNYFTSINEIPIDYKNAVIAVEDHRFESHGVIDIISIARAIWSNIKKQELAEGGSTITQQVAKNLYFIESKNNTIYRKIAEIFIGRDLENMYSKDEIFEIYMNCIYFGDGYYNIKTATKGYFNKLPSEMNLYECTLLAGIPNAPSAYAPTKNPNLAKKRQEKVISSMVKYGYLTQEEADEIL